MYAQRIQPMYTRNQLNILAIFCSQPETQIHLHEIGRILGKKPGVFQKAINSLETEGLLKSTRRGNQRLFSLNKSHPYINEVQKIVQKTSGIEYQLRSMVDKPGINIAFIYGSYAKNKLRPTSDVDIVVVGNRKIENYLLEEIDILEKTILREINMKFYTTSEYNQKKSANNAFLLEILDDRCIVLKGSP